MSKIDFSEISYVDIKNVIEKYKSFYQEDKIKEKNESILYDIIYEGVSYPAKLIFKMAYETVYGEQISKGKDGTKKINKFLKKLGYKVKLKDRHIFTYMPSNKDMNGNYIGVESVIEKIREEKKIFHSTLDADEDFTFISEDEYDKKYIKNGKNGNDYWSLKNFIYYANTFSLIILITNNRTIRMILFVQGNYKYNPNSAVSYSNHERKVQILWEGEIELSETVPKKLRASEQMNRIDEDHNNRVLDIVESFRENDMEGFNILKDKLNNKAFRYEIEDKNIFKEKSMIDMVKIMPLNQILYGPPGTGKTYHTIDKALQIIDGKVPESREEAKERFEALKEAGQIEFVTFHQSYGYEEFIEGIKADVKSETIRYVIEDGIFKSLSDKARKHFEDSQKSQSEIASEISQKDKIGDFLNKSLEDEKIFQKTKGGKFGIKDLTEKSIILYSEDSNYNENSITLEVEEFYKIINADIEFKTSRQIAQEVFAISNQRQKDTYYLSLYKEYKKVPFTETKINADMIENKNYLLIIDEINRGNISKIFGELITLIEESKRLGNDEAMEVTLPYSGEKFSVPKNLYIIGTMNTADRSIALMDTALRRRFEFEEIMPDYGVIRKEIGDNGVIDGIDIASMLEKINKRIEYLYDRDHTIGHAYFIGVKDKSNLDSVMRNKIIPLLQEYFYDDWEKIRLILNDGFIDRTIQDARKLFDSYIDDEYIEDDKYTYSIVSNFSVDAYRKIYGKGE